MPRGGKRAGAGRKKKAISKTCTKCGLSRPITEFRKSSTNRDRLTHRCRECTNYSRKLRYDASTLGRLFDRYSSLQHRASRFGEFDISFGQYLDLTSRPCAYGNGADPACLIGLDRKDSSLGYTIDNVVPCCPRHNLMKSNFFSFSDMAFITANLPSAKECGDTIGGRKKTPRL
jgi:hypothetical protein